MNAYWSGKNGKPINTCKSDAWHSIKMLITVSVWLCNTVLHVTTAEKRSSNRFQILLIDFYLSWSPAGPLAPSESGRRLMDSSFKLRQSLQAVFLSPCLPFLHFIWLFSGAADKAIAARGAALIVCVYCVLLLC